MTQIEPQESRNLLFICSIFIFFSVLTIILTFPLFFKMNSYMPGFFSTDEPSLWHGWWLKYSYTHNMAFLFSPLVAAPFGLDLSFGHKAFPIWSGITRFLAIAFNEPFDFNFQVLIGFILSAFFTYLMAVHLIKSRIAAIFSAIIFAFCPYHFVRAWQHLNLAYTQWIPLFLFAIFRLEDKINKKNIFLVFLSLCLVFAFDLYYAYFSVVIAATFIFHICLKKKKGSLKVIFWISIASLFNAAILAINLLPLMKTVKINSSPSAWGIVRPFEDLFSQSARPLSYFLPATVHPIFGKFTESFVGTRLYGESYTEHTLYLGWIPIVLAFIAFKRWKKRRQPSAISHQPLIKDEYYHIGFFILLLVVVWLFSQPPWWNIFSFKIYMPSFFMYKLLPMFRAYCRFGIVVMLAVAVLAGFGLKFILERFKSQKVKITIACLFSVLVLFEFWNWPPYKVIDVSKVPAVYYWLKEEVGDFTIAEYPLDITGPIEMYKFYQTKHGKKIINGTIPGTEANRIAKTLKKLSEKSTISKLKEMGVKYAVVHRDGYLETDLMEQIEELSRIYKDSGLKFIKTFPAQECPQEGIMCIQKTGPIDVYEVIAGPLEPKE